MKWHKLEKQIREHPYLLDDSFKMSMSAAQKLINESDTFSFEETIRKAMKKSDISEEYWIQSVAVLRKKKIAHKRFTIAAASITAAILLFCVTPIGRSVADSVMDIVISSSNKETVITFDDTSDSITLVSPEEIPEVSSEDLSADSSDGNYSNDNSDEESRYYDSFDDFFKDTGMNPIVLCDNDVNLKEICFYPENGGGMLMSTYESNKYGSITAFQDWFTGNGAIAFTEHENTKPVLKGEYTAKYGVYEKDNTFEATIIIKDGLFSIGMKNNPSAALLLDKLEYYK